MSEKELLVSAKMKSENKFYNGVFLSTHEQINFLKKENPFIILRSDYDGSEKECHFNDFEISIKTSDPATIQVLKDKNLATGGYDLIEILKEQNFLFE